MSPAQSQFQFHDHHLAKREAINSLTPSLPPSSPPSSPLIKINKDSHPIKKQSPSSTSQLLFGSGGSTTTTTITNTNTTATRQQRHPVIIYTHSPKIIHTHPNDFMALVQKLTGLSKNEQSSSVVPPPKNEPENYGFKPENDKIDCRNGVNDDDESSSAATDENNGSTLVGGDGQKQVNSCNYAPHHPNPIFDPQNSCLIGNSVPYFNQNPADFCSSSPQPFYNYSEPNLFFMPNMRSSYSSSTMEAMKDLPDF